MPQPAPLQPLDREPGPAGYRTMSPFAPGTTAWGLTDGKAGDAAQVLGLLERSGLSFEHRIVAPRAPWLWAMPFGPVDPREAPGRADGPLAGPLPDIVIATGRRTVASLRALKNASTGRIFTVFLKQPATGARAADLIWVPEHDRLRGARVITTLTSPHRISPERLNAAADNAPAALLDLARPRVAVLVGGPNRDYPFATPDQDRLIAALNHLHMHGCTLMVTPSRRTPTALAARLQALAGPRAMVWDGTGDNPLLAYLALADAIVVTIDSTNMLSEAPATGAPLLLFRPAGSAPKMERLASALVAHGSARWLDDTVTPPFVRRPPIDATPAILDAIATRYRAFRAQQRWA
jgi:hypothetical protein